MLVLIGYPRVDNVSYELELSAQLKAVHLVFQITMLKMYMGNPSVIIPTENIGAKDNLFYEKMSVQILDRQVRKLNQGSSINTVLMKESVRQESYLRG